MHGVLSSKEDKDTVANDALVYERNTIIAYAWVPIITTRTFAYPF